MSRTFAWLPWRRHPSPPPVDGRTWVHPSELPSFDSLAETRKRVRSRLARTVASMMVVALLVGGAGLASTQGVTPVNANMESHIVAALARLPVVARQAAARTVVLTIAEAGHVSTVAALVLPHDLAVTTTPIPAGALVTFATATQTGLPVSWVGRDRTLGFSIVRLSRPVTAPPMAPMPASAAVTAVVPIVTSVRTPPSFAWASTTLGDPALTDNGVVSYLSSQSNWRLDGFTDAIAVNAKGQVVAILSGNQRWYAATFVARVARIVAIGNGCHSSLGIRGLTAQGGGAEVTWVRPRGPSTPWLQVGDVIIRVGARDVDDWNSLLTVLYLTPAGSWAHITFLRGSHTRHAAVILACDL
ncbi:MAG TPA: PDZ domain-containing protein [Acidimicrobiales bacterium]|nr:PDZ domain-containing protein [Acidimicrobiales bacterium]